MKLGILLVSLGLLVSTFGYDIVQEDHGVLNPAAEPSAPTRTRKPHTGAFPSHLTTPSTTKAKSSSSTVALPVAAASEHHDQQLVPSGTNENVVRPVYSQSAYEIDLQPGDQREQQHESSSSYGSGSVAGPSQLDLSGASYHTSAPSQPSRAPHLPSSSSYSSPQPLPTLPPPPPHSQHVSHGSSYDVPQIPSVLQHEHQQPVSVPAYHTSWPAPAQPLSTHTSSSFSPYSHQQTGPNVEHVGDTDDSSEENDDRREEHSGGAFSVSFTAPNYAPIPHPLIPAYQQPQTTERPIVVSQHVPEHEPPTLSGFPQYQIPNVKTPRPHYEVPKITTPQPNYEATRAPAVEPQYQRPIPPATLPRYEPVRHTQTSSYQVVGVEAEPANAAYPSPAAPSSVEEIYPDDLSAIPGKPGQDYPQMAKIPQSSFNCGDKLPGYYADLDSQCQVWHFCDMTGRRESFLCPNGTLYNQEKFVCDWWYNVDCGLATSFFVRNEELYKVPVRTPVVQYQPDAVQQQGQYQQQEQPQQGHYQQQQGHYQQQQGHYQQQQEHYQNEQQEQHRGHHQQQQQQHGHYQQQEQHRGHQQYETVSSGHRSSYDHGGRSSYSLTQEHPSVAPQQPPQVIVSQQQQEHQRPRVTLPTVTPSYVSQSSTAATPVHSSVTHAPIYGQTISTQKPHQEESESHVHSSY